jgi:hypothetical protein
MTRAAGGQHSSQGGSIAGASCAQALLPSSSRHQQVDAMLQFCFKLQQETR